MKESQQILSIFIGESEAAACFDEIERRIQPDDPCELKIHIRQVTVEKYVNGAKLPLPFINEKLAQHPNIFKTPHILKEIEGLTERITLRLIDRIVADRIVVRMENPMK